MNEFELLHIMLREKKATAAELSERLGVSTRSVRTYIQRINDLLASSALIEHKRGVGYVLNVVDEKAFVDRLDEIRTRQTPSASSTSRVNYLLQDLLMRNDWVTLEDYSRVLFVSRATISSELKQVEERIAPFTGLSLERRSHYGIRIVGPEMQRRLCEATVAANTILSRENTADVHRRLAVISQVISRAAAEDSFEINSISYQNLLVHIAIALTRIEAGAYVPMEDEQLESLRSGASYTLAQKVAAGIQSELGFTLPEEEIAYIAIHLAGKRIFPDEGELPADISDEIWDVVSRMLDLVWYVYRFELRGDLELRMNLARHMVPLSVRLKYSMAMDNPLLEDIRAKYALAYSMAVDVVPVITEAFGGEMSEQEIGYIALAFALALERKRTQPAKKRLLVICASGRGSAKLLEYRMRQQFDNYIESIAACDIAHASEANYEDIDYVFTTVPLDFRPPVPVCNIPLFFDDGDARHIEDFFQADRLPDTTVLKFFRKSLFHGRCAVADRDEILRILCGEMYRCGAVPEEFERLVFDRETFMTTAFGGRIALPHAIKACGEQTVVDVALLDDPISWAGREVQAVFLISFSRNPEPELEIFYQCMAQLMSRPHIVDGLLEERSFEYLATTVADIEHELLRAKSR